MITFGVAIMQWVSVSQHWDTHFITEDAALLNECQGVLLASKSQGILTAGPFMSHTRAFLRLGPLYTQVHFFTDVPDPMTKTCIFLPFQSDYTAIYSRAWKAELEISGKGNCFTLERIIKQPPYLLFPRGQAEWHWLCWRNIL